MHLTHSTFSPKTAEDWNKQTSELLPNNCMYLSTKLQHIQYRSVQTHKTTLREFDYDSWDFFSLGFLWLIQRWYKFYMFSFLTNTQSIYSGDSVKDQNWCISSLWRTCFGWSTAFCRSVFTLLLGWFVTLVTGCLKMDAVCRTGNVVFKSGLACKTDNKVMDQATF